MCSCLMDTEGQTGQASPLLFQQHHVTMLMMSSLPRGLLWQWRQVMARTTSDSRTAVAVTTRAKEASMLGLRTGMKGGGRSCTGQRTEGGGQETKTTKSLWGQLLFLEPGSRTWSWSPVLEPGAGTRSWNQLMEPGPRTRSWNQVSGGVSEPRTGRDTGSAAGNVGQMLSVHRRAAS